MMFNQLQFNARSCFIDQIPAKLLEEERSGFTSPFASGMMSPRRIPVNKGIAPAKPGNAFGTPPTKNTVPAKVSNPLGIPGVQRGFSSPVPSPAYTQDFSVGDHVLHRKFGKGIVRKISGEGTSARICIDFPVFGEKQFSLSIAPIVKLDD